MNKTYDAMAWMKRKIIILNSTSLSRFATVGWLHNDFFLCFTRSVRQTIRSSTTIFFFTIYFLCVNSMFLLSNMFSLPLHMDHSARHSATYHCLRKINRISYCFAWKFDEIEWNLIWVCQKHMDLPWNLIV